MAKAENGTKGARKYAQAHLVEAVDRSCAIMRKSKNERLIVMACRNIILAALAQPVEETIED